MILKTVSDGLYAGNMEPVDSGHTFQQNKNFSFVIDTTGKKTTASLLGILWRGCASNFRKCGATIYKK